jgi:hypothetical protein
LTGTITDEANNTSDPATVTGGIDTTKPGKPTVVTEPNPDGTLKVTGTAEPGSSVTVRFPDGTTKTVQTDSSGHYTVTSDHPQKGGDVIAYTTDAAGNQSDETSEHYSSWYREEDDNGTSYIYEEEDSNGTTHTSTSVHVTDDLDVVSEEGSENGDIKLYVQSPTPTPASGPITKEAPEGCDLESYSAFAKLYKEDGSVVTGFAFSDPACAGVSDATLYEGKPLKFVPGTTVRMEKDITGKGDAVIVIDALLTEETRFGEK